MDQQIDQIQLEYLTLEDYDQLKEVMDEAYKGMPDLQWMKTDIRKLIKKFPKGQVVIKVDGKVAGAAFSIIVNEDGVFVNDAEVILERVRRMAEAGRRVVVAFPERGGLEADALGELVGRTPIDVAFLGIGENGHIAFNDPPADCP